MPTARRGFLALGLALGAAITPGRARGETDRPASVRSLSASPDTPAFGFAWRGAVRGTLGAEIPVLSRGERELPYLQVVPLVELHNDAEHSIPLPNANWRARLALETWWEVPAGADPRRRLAFGFAIEHESDHATARYDAPDSYLSIQDGAFRSTWTLPVGPTMLTFALDVRVYALSCTTLSSPSCGGVEGSWSVGGESSIVWDARGWRGRALPFFPYLSVDGSGILPNGELVREGRVVANLGVSSWGGRFGRWSGFLLVFSGNDVGVERAQTFHQLGAGLRWTPPW